MLVSMTGFGKAECEPPGKKVSIEVKSLNSKQLDIITKLPGIYREKDLEIRNEIFRQLQRGKIEISISMEIIEPEQAHQINEEIVKNYIRQLREIINDTDLDTTEPILQIAMRLPESLQPEKEELDEEEWAIVLGNIKIALQDVKDYREREGVNLEKDIIIRINNIYQKIPGIEKYEKQRIGNIKSRIKQSLEELKVTESYDPNRFEQELIYYLEKYDITEEKIRLKNHCNYFLENIESTEPVGKKLGFITQEIGREINTLGAKAYESNIQRIVVEMKDELEKVKEQILNVL